ncbi:unnamed protein product, partial [Brassica oleracea]
MGASQEVNSSNDRRSSLERLALPSNHPLPTREPIAMTLEGPPSASRVPALQRIEPPLTSERTPLLQNGDRRHLASICANNQPLTINEPSSLGQPITGVRAKERSAVSKTTGKRKASEPPASKKHVV